MRRQKDSYESAMEEALAVPPQRLREKVSSYPARDSIHDRERLHRRKTGSQGRDSNPRPSG